MQSTKLSSAKLSRCASLWRRGRERVEEEDENQIAKQERHDEDEERRIQRAELGDDP